MVMTTRIDAAVIVADDEGTLSEHGNNLSIVQIHIVCTCVRRIARGANRILPILSTPRFLRRNQQSPEDRNLELQQSPVYGGPCLLRTKQNPDLVKCTFGPHLGLAS